MKMKKQKTSITILFFALLVMPAFSSALDYSGISIWPEKVNVLVNENDFFEGNITFINNRTKIVSLNLEIAGNISNMSKLQNKSLTIGPGETKVASYTLFGPSAGSILSGTIEITGAAEATIPINLAVTRKSNNALVPLLMDVKSLDEVVRQGGIGKFKIDIHNLLAGNKFNVTLVYTITDMENGDNLYQTSDPLTVSESFSLMKEIELPPAIITGSYILVVGAVFKNTTTTTTTMFNVKEPFLNYMLFGIMPLWAIVSGFTVLVLFFVAAKLYKQRVEKKKRYKSMIDYATLPEKGERSVCVGKIAETTRLAHFEIDQLSNHTVIAGSTGGGKTVSAEVLVEEALLKDVSVIVFDPTAQWTGFLRKCENKKMIALYPDFGLKKTDARAFNGNVYQVKSAEEKIDIKKFMIPGEISCFAINLLDPKDIDIVVANTINQVFKANLPESSTLKLLIIFDEVHRLLPKFGGSGQGFIMVERAAREFRKYGVGLMLISQVLSDFVGEVKANIGTEIQMRTRNQGDLDRIKMKYGEYMLQSLLKASTGTGMLENPAYNRGRPYFVSFRPLMHEHARLTDEELSEYNKYNSMIDDLDARIAEQEKKGADMFDIKLELKLAKDKLKTGNFRIVDIYLEGMKERISGK
jgi:hypothetical protein